MLFTQSPGGVMATAARVQSVRPLIDAASRGSGIDPNALEGIVFVESAGRADAMVGGDPAAASGLTQILPDTGRTLLGMRIDVAKSRKLTRSINHAASLGQDQRVARLTRARERSDERFDPSKALSATVRYLEQAQARFGRADLAVVSYHMGIGNLRHVLDLYDRGQAIPYVQLYFDTAPDHHRQAFSLLSAFGDDSSLYWWRVLGAEQIMHLYRSDRTALQRLDSLQGSYADDAAVLHPPDRTPRFSDPEALAEAYATRALVPLPQNGPELGVRYGPAIGSLAQRLGAPAALYLGLRPPALDLLIALCSRVRRLSGSAAPLMVLSAVSDTRYEQAAGDGDFPAATGFSFQIARAYSTHAQARSLQAVLDRLQALNLIAWTRSPDAIEVTVAGDAGRVITHGP